MPNRRKWIAGFVTALTLCSVSALIVCAETEAPLQYADAEEVTKLQIKALHESSGLAVSRLRSDILWSHNDSGDRARLFAFDTSGTPAGVCDIKGAKARDWEDMASFTKNGKPYLLVADTGDNSRKRAEYKLYRIPELPPTAGSLTVDQVVSFKFEKGPCDCEAIAFDSTLDQVVLIDKGWDLKCRVYVLDWPNGPLKQPLIARRTAVLKVAGVTGLDISPDGRRAIALTYGPAYEFVREEGETWKQAFSRKGRVIRMPVRRQGEAICYAADGKTLFLTSEQRPTPLFRVAISGDCDSSTKEAADKPASK